MTSLEDRAGERHGGTAVTVIGAVAASAIAYLVLRRTSLGKKVQAAVGAQVDKAKEKFASSSGEGVQHYLPLIREASVHTGVPVSAIIGTMMNESGANNRNRIPHTGNPPRCGTQGYDGGKGCLTAIPDKNGYCAIGLMQIKHPVARELGFQGSPEELCIPANNILYGAKYLAQLAKKYADPTSRHAGDGLWTAVYDAYRCGPGSYDRSDECSLQAGERYAARAEMHRADAATAGMAGLGHCSAQPRRQAPRLFGVG